VSEGVTSVLSALGFKSLFSFDANSFYFKLEQSSQLLRILLITTTLASLALGHSILATSEIEIFSRMTLVR
jgi:hypothetical protein